MTYNLIDLILEHNVFVRFYELPGGSLGLSKKTKDGYLILLNQNLESCRTKAMKTVEHEMLHVLLGHHDERKELSIAEKEAEVEQALTCVNFITKYWDD